ncbi:MAG: orotidine-5'-phosphate decarboxylase [Phycisphaerae bacterium]
MPENFADRLLQTIAERRTPAVVALDPVYERLPAEITAHRDLNDAEDAEAALDAVLEFCRNVIQIVAPLVPAIKINSAYFERYYGEGIEGYYDLVQEAADRGLIVIGDVKRGDVGHSSDCYAAAHLLDSPFVNRPDLIAPDAITINGYFGGDGVRPFVGAARDTGRGLFVLVRTSNESSREIQDLPLADGRAVHEAVAQRVAEWACEPDLVGQRGYSAIGAVVASRDAAAARRLRELMPQSLFLVPGYGAQGMTAEQCAPYFRSDGSGAIVAAGRSVIYAFDVPSYRERYASDWKQCVAHACRDFIGDLSRVVRIGS